jgi:hypothetical protein
MRFDPPTRFWRKTRTLTETLREEIKAAQAMIETTRRSVQQTKRVLDRSPPAVNRGRNGA